MFTMNLTTCPNMWRLLLKTNVFLTMISGPVPQTCCCYDELYNLFEEIGNFLLTMTFCLQWLMHRCSKKHILFLKKFGFTLNKQFSINLTFWKVYLYFIRNLILLLFFKNLNLIYFINFYINNVSLFNLNIKIYAIFLKIFKIKL